MRVEYWQTIRDISLSNLIFLDETGLQLGMTQRYARAESGKRAYGVEPYSHGQIITLIGAISFNQVVTTMTVNGGTNGNVFRTFVEKMLVPQLGQGACVVADNLPAHKIKGISEAIAARGARLIYLSPYSPQFNPIEQWWSSLKADLRKKSAQTREELESAIANHIDLIAPKTLRHWFTHCCYCSLSS